MPISYEAEARRRCLALAHSSEKQAWGTPTFRVKDKLFAMWTDADSHNGKGREALWIKSDHDNQAFMIQTEPQRYFKPPYVGPSGWVGVYLNAKTDWKTLDVLLRDAWLSILPKKLLKALEGEAPPPALKPAMKIKRTTTPKRKTAKRTK